MDDLSLHKFNLALQAYSGLVNHHNNPKIPPSLADVAALQAARMQLHAAVEGLALGAAASLEADWEPALTRPEAT